MGTPNSVYREALGIPTLVRGVPNISLSLGRQHNSSLQNRAHRIHTEGSLGKISGLRLGLGTSKVRDWKSWTPCTGF